jgi:cell division protein FtsI/penicillin-binding protein 2
MRTAMTTGTGAGLPRVPGVRVYGKTGTADSVVIEDEQPYGLEPGLVGAAPHSWFVALAEPEDAGACDPLGTGRLAVAVVLPRGGGGAVAGAAAVEMIAAARELGYLGVL